MMATDRHWKNSWRGKRAPELEWGGHNRKPGISAAKHASHSRYVRRLMARALRSMLGAVRDT